MKVDELLAEALKLPPESQEELVCRILFREILAEEGYDPDKKVFTVNALLMDRQWSKGK